MIGSAVPEALRAGFGPNEPEGCLNAPDGIGQADESAKGHPIEQADEIRAALRQQGKEVRFSSLSLLRRVLGEIAQ